MRTQIKSILYPLLPMLVVLSITFGAKHEIWTSSAGSQIQGAYIGSTESQHWIASDDGRLFKLTEAQLSEESVGRIHGINEKKKPIYPKRSSLMPLDDHPSNEAIITTLCSSKIPAANFEKTPISSALESLNKIMKSNISYRVEGDIKNSSINISVRNLHADRTLDFITQQVGAYYRLEGGEIVISSQHP